MNRANHHDPFGIVVLIVSSPVSISSVAKRPQANWTGHPCWCDTDIILLVSHTRSPLMPLIYWSRVITYVHQCQSWIRHGHDVCDQPCCMQNPNNASICSSFVIESVCYCSHAKVHSIGVRARGHLPWICLSISSIGMLLHQKVCLMVWWFCRRAIQWSLFGAGESHWWVSNWCRQFQGIHRNCRDPFRGNYGV